MRLTLQNCKPESSTGKVLAAQCEVTERLSTRAAVMERNSAPRRTG